MSFEPMEEIKELIGRYENSTLLRVGAIYSETDFRLRHLLDKELGYRRGYAAKYHSKVRSLVFREKGGG